MNQSIKTGIVSGLLVVTLSILAERLLNNPAFRIIGYLPILVFVAGIYVGIKRTRDREHDGMIDFKTGLKAGFITGVISSILFSIYQFVNFTHTDVRAVVYEMKKSGYSNSDLVAFLDSVNKQTFFDYSLRMAAAYTIIGFLISIAATLILRYRKA